MVAGALLEMVRWWWLRRPKLACDASGGCCCWMVVLVAAAAVVVVVVASTKTGLVLPREDNNVERGSGVNGWHRRQKKEREIERERKQKQASQSVRQGASERNKREPFVLRAQTRRQILPASGDRSLPVVC